MNGGRIYKENLKQLSKEFINYIYELNVIEYLYFEKLINKNQKDKLLNKLKEEYKSIK